MLMSETIDGATTNVSALYPIIHDLQPLLDYDEPFTLHETSVGGSEGDIHQIKGPLTKALQAGALRKVERVRSAGKLRWRYEWQPDARKQLREHLEELETLPKCGHRIHLPDTRDDPAGVVSCKFCGTEYLEGFFMALVEDKL